MNRNDLLQENAGLKLFITTMLNENGDFIFTNENLTAAENLQVDVEETPEGNQRFFISNRPEENNGSSEAGS